MNKVAKNLCLIAFASAAGCSTINHHGYMLDTTKPIIEMTQASKKYYPYPKDEPRRTYIAFEATTGNKLMLVDKLKDGTIDLVKTETPQGDITWRTVTHWNKKYNAMFKELEAIRASGKGAEDYTVYEY